MQEKAKKFEPSFIGVYHETGEDCGKFPLRRGTVNPSRQVSKLFKLLGNSGAEGKLGVEGDYRSLVFNPEEFSHRYWKAVGLKWTKKEGNSLHAIEGSHPLSIVLFYLWHEINALCLRKNPSKALSKRIAKLEESARQAGEPLVARQVTTRKGKISHVFNPNYEQPLEILLKLVRKRFPKARNSDLHGLWEALTYRRSELMFAEAVRQQIPNNVVGAVHAHDIDLQSYSRAAGAGREIEKAAGRRRTYLRQKHFIKSLEKSALECLASQGMRAVEKLESMQATQAKN